MSGVTTIPFRVEHNGRGKVRLTLGAVTLLLSPAETNTLSNALDAAVWDAVGGDLSHLQDQSAEPQILVVNPSAATVSR